MLFSALFISFPSRDSKLCHPAYTEVRFLTCENPMPLLCACHCFTFLVLLSH